MDVNTSVTGGLRGSWRCPLRWDPNKMNKPERCRGLDGSQRGMNWKEKTRGAKRNGLELVICLQEEKDCLWEKATLMVHHDDVKEISEGNLPFLLIEELGKIKSTWRGIEKYIVFINFSSTHIQEEASHKRMHMVWLRLQKFNHRQNPPTILRVWVVVTLGDQKEHKGGLLGPFGEKSPSFYTYDICTFCMSTSIIKSWFMFIQEKVEGGLAPDQWTC